MIQQRQRFFKAERICAQKDVEALFSASRERSFIAYPLRVVYYLKPKVESSQTECQILISVSKKQFRRANKRNRIKRLIREAYRLNKAPWRECLNREGKLCQIAFMIVDKEMPSYQVIERAVLKAFRKIKAREFDTEEIQPNSLPDES